MCSVLERFGVTNARSALKPIKERFKDQLAHTLDASDFNPCPAIGALLYLAVTSRPDIATAVCILAQETGRPTEIVKRGIIESSPI
ncbi:hypothetical protein CCR75_008469 [Bremia lactucae]|uniref:Uncharacterized protein n=1 Tax=Bremia lactucae TaxID=4779 RepID=A0A976II65_BRELC|nr:hypothetical protein CCR75_008469 [Bremia lactucae]